MAEMAFSPDVPRRVKGLIKAPINGRINKSASPKLHPEGIILEIELPAELRSLPKRGIRPLSC
jgi:hypothetical protein